MDYSTLDLSRLQFAFTIGFHILFPTLTIGLASFLVVLEARWLLSGRRRRVFMQMYDFWLKIFAMGFAMGVVSGVVLSYEIGTNFSRYAGATANVLGPLFSYEVVTAFFLEAGFLGIMLFGRRRVGPRLHFFATLMVAVGTVLSAFWILSANSWMQTPAGFRMEGGRFFAEDWLRIVFNPSFPYRLAHMTIASYLTSAFVVAGVSAWYLLQRRHDSFARHGFSMAMGLALLLAPAQIVIGDLHGLNTQEHQPMKIAAMEAHWETRARAPFVVFAIPDMESETNHWAVEIPLAGSLILKHDADGVVLGLDQVAPEDRPYVPLVFFAFRVMLGIGFFFLLVALWGAVARRRGTLYRDRWLLRAVVLASPLGFVAVLAGWVVTEAGRQPWVVHGLMRTADSVSPIPPGSVLSSLFFFMVVYTALLSTFLYFVFRLIRSGPPEAEEAELPIARGRSIARTAQ